MSHTTNLIATAPSKSKHLPGSPQAEYELLQQILATLEDIRSLLREESRYAPTPHQ